LQVPPPEEVGFFSNQPLFYSVDVLEILMLF
jgi:hypothetical protein